MLLAINMKRVLLLFLSSSVLLLVSCGPVKINQILVDPSRYAEKEVEVEGTVVDSYSLIGVGTYRVQDDTGELWIVSTKGVPRRGSRVSVKGRIKDVLTLDDLVQLPDQIESGLLMIESSHKAKN